MSKGKFYVTSTLSADVTYRGFAKTGGDVPVAERTVTIKGGANIQGRLHTPRGVLTVLSAEDFEVCEADPVFLIHRERGFITFTQTESDPEAAASDMENRDKMAPMEEGDFDENDPAEPKPVINTPPAPAQTGRQTSKRRA